ncbi:MAG TPA: hypothetical protein VF171_09905 [Trueperaceae bacterium]
MRRSLVRTLYRITLLALLLWVVYWLMNHGPAWLPRLRRLAHTIATTTLGELAAMAWPILLAALLIAFCVYIVWRLPVPRFRWGRRGRRRR